MSNNYMSLGNGYQGNSPLTLSRPMQFNFGLPATPIDTPSMMGPNVGFGANAPDSAAADAAQAAELAGKPGVLGGFNNYLRDTGIIGSTDAKGMRTDGWGGLALSTAGGLFNAYMGMKQYGLAKKQLSFQKDAFERNYASQRTSLNTQLEDRQRARVASNAGAYQSVGDYMAKNRIA